MTDSLPLDKAILWLEHRRLTKARLDDFVRTTGFGRQYAVNKWFCSWPERRRLLRNGAVVALETPLLGAWRNTKPKVFSQQLHGVHSICKNFPEACLLCYIFHYDTDEHALQLIACRPEHVSQQDYMS